MSMSVLGHTSTRLKLVGFSDSDKSTFEAILAIADRRLTTPWQLSSSMNDADFYLLAHRLRAQFDEDKLLKKLSREQCIFCSTEQTNGTTDHELLVDKNNIPYLKSLVELFNQLSPALDQTPVRVEESSPQADISELVGKESAQSASPLPAAVSETLAEPVRSRGFFIKKTADEVAPPAASVPVVPETRSNGFFVKKDVIKKAEPTLLNAFLETEKTGNFDPAENPFIKQLLAKTNDILLFGLHNVGAVLYVDLAGKSYYSAGKLDQLQPYFAIENNFSVQMIAESQLQSAIVKAELKPQPLSNLLWYSVFSCSQGRIIVGHQADSAVRLRRWPDINLPGCQKLIKLAAYMHSNTVDLQTVQTQTGIPMDKVHDFYNACQAINLIDVCQEVEVHEKTMDEQQRELYAKIGKSINLKLDRK